MPSSGFFALLFVVALVVVAALTGFRIGGSLSDERWRHYADDWHDRLANQREAEFARAAQAVGIWPHRVDRRAELLRHLASLADAPEIGTLAEESDGAVDEDERAPVVDVYRAEGFL